MLARIAALLASRGGACFALAVFVFASRAWLIDTWGSALPFMDQWDAEASLYHNWVTDTLRWSDFFAPHNEHRIFFTRAADLALFALHGGWNPWAQLLLNASLHAATATLLAALFWPALAGRARGLFLAGLALLSISTAGWQNALWGFQSQVYFTNLLALGGLGALVLATPATVPRWLAPVLFLAALFASAGGLLAAFAGQVMFLFFPRSERRGWKLPLAVIGVSTLGVLLHVAPSQHEALRAQSIGQFLAVAVHSLSWPHVESGWLWLIVQAPVAGLLILRGRQRAELDAGERLAVGLVVFAGLNAAAIAYSRGAGLPELRPLSRYQDPLLLGAVGNLFAALKLASSLNRAGRLLVLAWSTLMVAGLIALATTHLTLNLPYKRTQDAAGLAQIQAYLATHDGGVFTADPRHPPPHPNPKVIQRVLDDPVLQPALPPALRPSAPDTKPWPIAHARLLFGFSAGALGATLLFLLRAPQIGRTPR